VTAYRDAEGIATATTDANGDAIVPFVPLAPGEISLTARQPGSPTEVANVDATSTTDAPGPGGSARLAFAPPRPNPSSGDVSFSWTVPVEAFGGSAKLAIHDLAGRIVRMLEPVSGASTNGLATWDGRDASGGELAPGLYVARLVVGGRVFERRLVRTR
jgi:hypothetical protein